MKKVSKATIARTVVLMIALLNQVLTMSGHNPLPFSEDEIYTVVTGILTVGATVWAWWKNNSFTPAAIAGDEYKDKLKNVE